MKKWLVITVLVTLFTAIAYLFWYVDWKYSLPTPVPQAYLPVAPGSPIDLDAAIALEDDKPVFLHFFNPRCPCSRFNIPEFKSLVRQYHEQVAFAVVVMSKGERYTEEEIRDKFDLELPISFDERLAPKCGVYSTPQAVLIDADRKLYYRGNYNKSRYCTEKKTNYAAMAIDSLLHGHARITPDLAALRSYGCELPKCNKQ